MSSAPHNLPLRLNERTKEPYLQLPEPHGNIIITPPRQTEADIAALVSIMNERAVWQWLEGPPYPYNEDHARSWLAMISRESDDLFAQLQDNPYQLVGGCPVRILREVLDNGEDIFLGDIRVDGCIYSWVLDAEERNRLTEENIRKRPGDPSKDWEFGGDTRNDVSNGSKVITLSTDYLAPSHHGKGIMSLAIKTLIHEWLIPKMGIKKMSVVTYDKNIGSARVFERNGFVLEKIVPDARQISEVKGGGTVGFQVLHWRLPG